MLLSLTLTQAARSAGRSCLFTHYNCHCHIASPPMTSTLFLSLTHSRCLLPILISILLQLLPCPLLLCACVCVCAHRPEIESTEDRAREVENIDFVYTYVRDYSIHTYKIEIVVSLSLSLSLSFGLSFRRASPNPSFVKLGHRVVSNQQNIHKKCFAEVFERERTRLK